MTLFFVFVYYHYYFDSQPRILLAEGKSVRGTVRSLDSEEKIGFLRYSATKFQVHLSLLPHWLEVRGLMDVAGVEVEVEVFFFP